MAAPGEALIIKIWETLADRGMGGLLRPWQMCREGKAISDIRRHEELSRIRTEEDIRAFYDGKAKFDEKGQLVRLALPKSSASIQIESEPPSLLGSLGEEEIIRSAKRSLNIRKIFALSEEEAEADPDAIISDDAVDPDWFSRWRANAEDVTSEEVQRLWARILKGEVQQPGSYSLHTLEFMRRMSKEEAVRISNIAPLVFENHFIFEIDKNDNYVKFDDLLYLEHLGLIMGASSAVGLGIQRLFTSNEKDRFILLLRAQNYRGLLIEDNDPSHQFRFSVMNLTQIGREIFSLGKFEENLDYIETVGKYIKKKTNKQVSICKWHVVKGNHIRFEKLKVIE